MRGDQRGRRYDGRDVSKCREAKDTSGASCNEEITREKSVRKEARCERERERFI
jgi:hypothetical protein